MSDAEGAAVFIRAAEAADQQAIEAAVREARINPLGIHWPHFLVAVAAGGAGPGQIVAIGQIKHHPDGSRELASIAVAPAHQRSGLAAALIHELLRREPGELYLYCRESLGRYYARFGFVEIAGAGLPRSMRPLYRAGRLLGEIFAPFTGTGGRLIAMRRPAAAA